MKPGWLISLAKRTERQALGLIIAGFSAVSTATTVQGLQVQSGSPQSGQEQRVSQDRVRIGTIYFSESFINEQLVKNIARSESLKSLELDLKQAGNTLRVHGLYQLPVDDIESLGLDPRMMQFRFQLSVQASINKEGYLVLRLPLEQSYFYQANRRSEGVEKEDRILIPVQLLSLGLATARSRLAALSGDFSGLDRKKEKLSALIRGIDQLLKSETNADVKVTLMNRKRALELQLESERLTREQIMITARSLKSVMDLLGVRDFNLSNKLKAEGNTLFLKLKLTSLISYLKDIELGAVRVQHKDRYGQGEDYLALDVDSLAASGVQGPLTERLTLPSRQLEIAPSIHIRLNQEILLKNVVREAKARTLEDKVEDFHLQFQPDGLHVTGNLKFWFLRIPFDSLVDFVSTGPDFFEVRLRKIRAWGLSLKPLVPLALKAIENRLESLFKGLFTYEYIGRVDGAKVLKVTVDSQKLVPAFPGLHLLDIDVLDGSIMLRIGRTAEEKP